MSTYIKHPKIYHLPWSPNLQNDDRMHKDVSFFSGKEVVASIKCDGENTSMYRDHIHARSLDSGNHPSREWVKAFHGRIAHEIPDGFRICGENLYAKHSIHYHHLPGYFLVFSVWDSNNFCLSWDNTLEYVELLGMKTVPVFYRGIWDSPKIGALFNMYINESKDEVEGYVVRLAAGFRYDAFQLSIGKYVRKNHVQTDAHWMTQTVVPNALG